MWNIVDPSMSSQLMYTFFKTDIFIYMVCHTEFRSNWISDIGGRLWGIFIFCLSTIQQWFQQVVPWAGQNSGSMRGSREKFCVLKPSVGNRKTFFEKDKKGKEENGKGFIVILSKSRVLCWWFSNLGLHRDSLYTTISHNQLSLPKIFHSRP